MEEKIDVFLSYCIQSASDKVEEICKALEKDGIRCWYCERDADGDPDFEERIVPAIDACKVFLLFLDQGANGSPHVKREVKRAGKRKDLPIIYLQIEKIEEGRLNDTLVYYRETSRIIDGRSPGGIEELRSEIWRHLPTIAGRPEKVFRDSVHGYIGIPEDYVRALIDTELFQRLREIEQTGMRVLYPAARHDRFVHSLGVYHLGRKAFAHFRRNVARDFAETHYRLKEDMRANERSWDRYQMLFEIACLLHDCGHAPFSHALESFYDMEAHGRRGLTEELASQFPDAGDFQKDLEGKGAPHERMSALLACTEYGAAVRSLLDRYGLLRRTEEDPLDPLDPLEFIVRAIVGCPYQCARPEDGRELSRSEQIGNCLIGLLNSDSIDVDSLDYIIRDAQMSGVDNMSIDVDRLLSALTLSEITRVEEHVFTEEDGEIGITVLGGTLTGTGEERALLSGRIRGGLETEGLCEASIRGTVELKGSLKILGDAEIDGTARIGGIPFSKIHQTEDAANVELAGTLKGPLRTEGAFRLSSGSNARAELTAGTVRFSSTYVDGRLRGRFSGRLLGDHARSGFGKVGVECQLGFHKSCLSVMQNVVIARNLEYRWVFSHHKVVYHANYLIVELLRQCVRYLEEKGGRERKEKKKLLPFRPAKEGPAEIRRDPLSSILSWEDMVGPEAGGGPCEVLGIRFWRPTDADILALFKRCEIEAREDPQASPEFRALLEGYASRRYRRSLWKSYAEMDQFLEATASEIRRIRDLLLEHSDKEKDDRPNRYGYLDRRWKKSFLDCGLDDVVWVDGGSKLKDLDPDKTYIRFKDRDVTYGSVRDPANVRPIKTSDLFYIYYRPVEGRPVDRDGLVRFLRLELDKPPGTDEDL